MSAPVDIRLGAGGTAAVGGWRTTRPARAIGRATPAIQLAPAVLIFVACLVLPLTSFVMYSFWTVENYDMVPKWSLENYAEIVSGPSYVRLLFNTVTTGLITATATTAVAYAFAHALRFSLRRYQERILFLVLVAMFSGYLVRIFAWRTLLGDQGVINTLLMQVGLISEPLTFLMYNRFATVLVLANFLIPTAVLPVYAALQNIRDSEVEAARDLGCGATGAWARVTLPLAWPGVFTAFSLSFILVCGDYTTPTLVGGTSGMLIGQAIGESFLNQFDWPLGAALSFTTLIIVLLTIVVLRWVSGKVVR